MKNRHSVRLREYDYRQSGFYFVTICAPAPRWRLDVYGRIEQDTFCPNRYGRLIMAAWQDLPLHHPTVTLDAFVLMPNHLHGLLALENDVESDWQPGAFAAPQAHALGTIIGSFKAAVTREINKLRDTQTIVWQRGFYEHIVRHEKALLAVRRYIAENPARWQQDELNAEVRDAGLGSSGHGLPCPYDDPTWQPAIPYPK